MSARFHTSILAMTLAGCLGCGEQTPIQRVTFNARAGGLDRTTSGPLVLHTSIGWDVTLTDAQISIASMYFHNAPPDNGPVPYDGRAVAEVLAPFIVDALDPQTHEITGGGRGTTEAAMVGEVRFGAASTGLISAGGTYAIAYVAGNAVRGEVTVAFAGTIALGNDPARSDYQGSTDRRLSRLPVSFTSQQDGTLTLRVDPTHWFDQVAFDALGPPGAATRVFDSSADALRFRNGLASASNAFQFTWAASH